MRKIPGMTYDEAAQIVEEELPKLGHGATNLIESIAFKIAENPGKFNELKK